ncbi:MAG TPA: hypothetical protein VE075_12580, partial [Thermoanaerobaculia bacterium]|nr:hypothetical protein [Thermoanaerobaculia bacterium]
MKSIAKNVPAAARVAVLTWGALLLLWCCAPVTGLWAQTQAEATTDGQSFPIFNPPPFDFNDPFYTANGLDVTQLDTPAAARFGFFRQTGPPAHDGQVNWVIDNTGTDP